MPAISLSLEDRDLTKILTMRSLPRESKPMATKMVSQRKFWRKQVKLMKKQVQDQDFLTVRKLWLLGNLANISMTKNQQSQKWATAIQIAIYLNQIREQDCILKKELLMLEIQDTPPLRPAVSWEVLQLDSMCCMKEKYLLIMPRKFNRPHLIRTTLAITT